MKLLVKVAILLVLCLSGGAFYGWQQFKPIAAELKIKDQEKFDLMLAEAKSFGFGEAQRLYEELDTMTPSDVVSLRHRKWQEKLEMDEEYRNSYLEEQYKLREKESVKRKSRYDLKQRVLLLKPKEGELLSKNWKKKSYKEKSYKEKSKKESYKEKSKKESYKEKSKKESKKKIVFQQLIFQIIDSFQRPQTFLKARTIS